MASRNKKQDLDKCLFFLSEIQIPGNQDTPLPNSFKNNPQDFFMQEMRSLPTGDIARSENNAAYFYDDTFDRRFDASRSENRALSPKQNNLFLEQDKGTNAYKI